MTFKDLLIKPELIDALQVQNITQPTQIQCKAAKPVFDGRDMIACSSTGSGKTLGTTDGSHGSAGRDRTQAR